jgi:hypothetical protein
MSTINSTKQIEIIVSTVNNQELKTKIPDNLTGYQLK